MIYAWILLGLGVYYFVRNNEPEKTIHQNGKQPEDILKERFLNGEIDAVTYEKMKMTIKA